MQCKLKVEQHLFAAVSIDRQKNLKILLSEGLLRQRSKL